MVIFHYWPLQCLMPQCSPLWKKIWNNDGLPKINIFCWIMIYKKLLTAKNLRKRGIQGPSRCEMCATTEETIQHLFFECNISKEVWLCAFVGISHRVQWPASWVDMFTFWRRNYQGSFKNKNTFKRVWTTLPKFICWKL
jgi:hypothetical protein